MKRYRYPGARPFEQEQSDLFFGRNEDVIQLLRKVKLSPLTVLYGKSGLGKSSLLNAGLIPLIQEQENYTCVRIRFGAWQADRKDPILPLPNCVAQVRQVIDSESALDALVPQEEGLWRLVKEHTIANGGKKGMLLVFDQFEELFSYPESEIKLFRQQLAEALYTPAPQRYWDALEEGYERGNELLPRSALQILQANTPIKVVLAIRSDRMHLLERLSDYFPLILKNLFELKALDQKNARMAMTEPAFLKGPFITPRFTYEPAALDKIIDYLTDQGTAHIESTQLQIICHHLEQEIASSGAFELGEADVGELDEVVENYYDEKLTLIDDPNQVYAARRLIEEGLVFEEEERRLSIYEGQALRSFDLKSEVLQLLVDSHLLRAEPSLRGGYTYELSHDTLIKPILKAKRERLSSERTAEEVKALAERQQERLAERRKRQRAYGLAIGGLLLALISITTAWWAIRQGQIADKARKAISENAFALQFALANNLKVEGKYDTALDSLQSAERFLTREDLLRQKILQDTFQAWQQVAILMEQSDSLKALQQLGRAQELVDQAVRISGDTRLYSKQRSLLQEREKRYTDLIEQARAFRNTGRRNSLEKTIQQLIELGVKSESDIRAEI